jgi:hypothetical protein
MAKITGSDAMKTLLGSFCYQRSLKDSSSPKIPNFSDPFGNFEPKPKTWNYFKTVSDRRKIRTANPYQIRVNESNNDVISSLARPLAVKSENHHYSLMENAIKQLVNGKHETGNNY